MAARKKTTAAPTLVDHIQRDYEISVPLIPDEKWTFRWNGDLVTKTEYDALVKEHEQWVKQQSAPVVETAPKRAKRSK